MYPTDDITGETARGLGGCLLTFSAALAIWILIIWAIVAIVR